MQKVKKLSKQILSVFLALVLTLAYVPLLNIQSEAADGDYKIRVKSNISAGSGKLDESSMTITYVTNNGSAGETKTLTFTPTDYNSNIFVQDSEDQDIYIAEQTIGGFPTTFRVYIALNTGGTGRNVDGTYTVQVYNNLSSQWEDVVSTSGEAKAGLWDRTNFDSTVSTDASKYPYVNTWTVSDTSDVYISESGSTTRKVTLSAVDQYGVSWVNAPSSITATESVTVDSEKTATPTFTFPDKLADYQTTINATYTNSHSSGSTTMSQGINVKVTRSVVFDNLFDYQEYRKSLSSGVNGATASNITSTGFMLTSTGTDYGYTSFNYKQPISPGNYTLTFDAVASGNYRVFVSYYTSADAGEWDGINNGTYNNASFASTVTNPTLDLTVPEGCTYYSVRIDSPNSSGSYIIASNFRVVEKDSLASTVTVSPGSIPASANKKFSNYTAPIPSKVGYTFTGWYFNGGLCYDANGNWDSSVYGDLDVAGYTSAYRTDLYSQWSANTYNVLFDNLFDYSAWKTAGITGTRATVSDITDTGFVLTSTESGTNDAYSGWSQKVSLKPDTTYRLEADIEFDNSVGGGSYEVFINMFQTDGSTSDTDFITENGTTRGSQYYNTTNQNYVQFTTSSDSGYVRFRFDVNNYGNILKVNNIRLYEVGTVADGVSYHSSQTATYDSTYGTLPTPTRLGYQFGGWMDAAGNTYTADQTVKITSDTTLYSQWTANSYTVEFNSNGGSAVDTITYTPDDTLTLPPSTRAGYTFAGWEIIAAWGGSNDTEKELIESQIGSVFGVDYSRAGCFGSYSVKALWTKNNYTVTFDENGGGDVSDITYTIEDTITLPSTSKTGYTFAGWKLSSADGNWTTGTYAAGNQSSKYGNITLVAQWTPIPYAITFYNYDGTVLQQSDVDYDSTPVYSGATPAKPSDNGYDYAFAGWNPAISTVTGAASYTATFTSSLIPYTITLDAGEGSVSTSTIDYNFESTSVTIPDATRTGYTFTGWTVKAAVGSWTAGESVTGALSSDYGNVTLVANYTANSYTLTYDANGGTIADGYSSTKSVTYDKAVGELLAEVTRTGYTFAGWNTKADGTGTTITAEYVWNFAENVTVYAQWTVNEYTITFTTLDATNNVSGFVTAPSSITYTIEDDLSALLPSTDNVTGYDFAGWQTSKSAQQGNWVRNTTYQTADLTTGNWGNVALTMKYTAKSYTITWVNSDGTVLETDTVYYNTIPTYDGATPTIAADTEYSYTFSNWSPAIVAATEDATYTAQYTKTVRTYTIKFVDWNGDVISSQELTYNATVEVPEDPTREQDAQYTYTFVSWVDENGAACSTIPNATADATYIADYTGTVRSYTIKWIVDGTETTETLTYGSTPDYGSTPTKTADAQYTYTFAGWSPSIATVTGNATYTAQFSSTVNQYTVKFVNEDGTVLDTQTLDYGSTPEYKGVTPTKAADVQYTYTFAGWNPEIDEVTGDVTYTATYSSTVNKYTITFVDEDGTQLQSSEVAYGETPAYTGATPTKAATAQYTYTHSGWTPSITAVTGEATYTATYSSTVNKYTITWIVDGVSTEVECEYGSTPDYGSTPTKTATAKYTYTFDSWDKEIATVTEDATYTAKFTETINKYTIKFVNADGTVLQSSEVAYDEVPAYTGSTPTKAATAQYTYTFAGWDNTVVAVTCEATYTATYTSTVNQYTVKFVDEDGTTVLKTQTLDYGATPTAPADPSKDATAQYTYTFSGWSPEIAKVTGNATYTAQYTATTNEYTITFVNEDGTTISTDKVAYGTVPTAPANPTKAADAQYTYTFAGWSPAIANVTGDATYKATYTTTVNEYTITFYDEDGTQLQSSEVAYGETPSYTGETPTKDTDGQYTYAFSGWAASQNGTVLTALPTVTGDAGYYAVFVATNAEFDVTWYNEDGTVNKTEKVKYGTSASTLTFPTADDRASTAQYDYELVGWNVTADSETALDLDSYQITAATSFYPAYSKTVREYTITFYDEDGTTVLQSGNVAYGTTPSYTGETPTKTATAQYTYTFAGWSPEIASVTGDATYKATYTETTNKYTVRFLNDDGTVISTQSVAYGSMPEIPTATKKADAQYTYTFKSWDKEIVAVTGAATYTATYSSTVNKYIIKFVNADGTELQSGEVEYGTTPVYNGETPTKTGTAQYSYEFIGWTPEISTVTGVATYTATYKETVNKYTITWVTGAGTYTGEWEYGATPDPATDNVDTSKPADAQYTYTFTGWDNKIASVTSDATYNATYSSTVNKYTIKFVNADGTVLQSSEVEYGTTPSYTGATPTKAADAQYTYTFKSWDKEIVSVTGAATYTATYSSTVNKYTIKFVNADGTVLQSSEVEYGTTPSYTGATPTKTADAQYTYTFAGWNTEIVSVTGAATYTATYSSTVNKYIIKFVNTDGTVLQSSEVEYGTTPSYTGATPTKAADVQYTYTHSGWTPSITAVTGEVTYTATYSSTVNEYTITWVTGAGTYTGKWAYGSTPNPETDGVDTSKESTASTDYAFSGWDAEISEVTGIATYTAQYNETTRKYTITWVVDGTSTEDEVEYGTVPTAPASPSKDSTVEFEYTFTGWDKEVVAVTGKETYTAEFAQSTRKYTVIWVTGTDTYTTEWEYGSTPDPDADNVDTSKAATAEASYTFTGWDKEIKTVTTNVTYTAQYYSDVRSYEVTYIIDNEVVDIQTVKFGSSFSHPEIPAKEGYNSYWDVSYMTMPASDIEVVAVYTPKKYNVTWIVDGKEYATDSVSYGTAITTQAVPLKAGHDGEWDYVPETMPAEDVTITAVYTPATYSVVWTFSTVSGSDTATYGETWSVIFINYIPGDVRITIDGTLLSTDNYTYSADTGYLQINSDAIIGNIVITERAAEGYQNVTISAVNATLTNIVSIIKEGTAFHTQIVPNEGYLLPSSIVVCIDGVELYSGYSYDFTTGKITVNGDVIYGELSIRFESPVDPEYNKHQENKSCSCNCHSSNAFIRFFFSIATFFRKLFGMDQYRYCNCGNAHW